jgi:exocyst complex component 2
VESNFERFVRAKATIDNVYKEMRNQGLEPEALPQAASHRKSHSRQLSRGSQHFRKTSGPFSPTFGAADTPPPNEKRKNALIKESEYGVLPIKAPLMETAVKAEEVWGPALGGREKEDGLKAVLGCIEKHRRVFEIGTSISACIKRKDNEALVEEYVKARKYADDAKAVVDTAVQNRVPLSDADVHQVIVTARMWADVEEQIESFKRDVWRRLTGTHLARTSAGEEHRTEEHMELISILLELGVPDNDNPIWYWLVSRYDYLKGKMAATFERSRVEIEILRRRLANGEKPTSRQLAGHLRTAMADGRLSNTGSIDSPKVIDVWEHIYASMNALLSTQGGVLGELLEYWETAQSFIEERAQRTLPSGIDGQSRKHHRLSVKGVSDLTNGAVELVNMLRDDMFSFFSDPPIEDLSLLLSPIPPTPETPTQTPMTPRSAALSPFADTKFRFDPNNVPLPSPRRGEHWEKYGFWPPHANSLSGAHYLSRILVLVGTAATEMASLSFMRDGNKSTDNLKSFVSGIRERCVQATCTAWNEDAGHCKVLEDWTRAPDRHDLTKMPTRFMNFEGFLLSNLQKILYVSEATRRPDSPEIIIQPSSKLLAIVRSQFVSSIYASLTAMVENADQPSMVDDGWEGDADGLAVPEPNGSAVEGETGTLDASNKVHVFHSGSSAFLSNNCQKIRILVTLSNVQALKNEVVPHLITLFETNFSVKLTDETNDIRNVLGRMDSKLFQNYVSPISTHLDRVIKAGISSPDWEPTTPRPTDARPYVYSVLLNLVLVHTEVSTTASPLTAPILKHLLESISTSLITAFKERPKYSLPALMQATLDVEFLAQTMNQYTTEQVGATQSSIYVALDERTDNDARVRLQDELQEIKGMLKRLREATRVEFVCFKRVRAHTVGK